MTETILWHYTTGQNLVSIFQDGLVRPATAGVPRTEKPIVWFSANQYWEQTASKMARMADGSFKCLSMQETGIHGKGLARIGVDRASAPYGWEELGKLSGMSRRTIQGLERAAVRNRAKPQEWFGAFDPIPKSKWVAVEYFKDGEWTPLPLRKVMVPATEQERA